MRKRRCPTATRPITRALYPERAVGEGPFEMRAHHGPGYRLYCLRDVEAVVVLCGGDKSSRQWDIERVGRLAKDWRRT